MEILFSKEVYVPVSLIIGTYVVLWLIKNIGIVRLQKVSKKTETYIDDLILDVLGATRQYFIIGVSLFIGFQALELDKTHGHYADKVLIVLIAIQSIIWGKEAVRSWVDITIKRKNNDPSVRTSMGFLGLIMKFLLIAVIILFALNNLGFNVSTFITGLGVGGIAIALATQNILGDLFSSLSIVMDKPFIVGDFVSLGEWVGTIEHVGLKTTRIRSLSGEQIVISNTDLLKTKIRNFKRMQTRRVVFGLNLKYTNSREELKKVPSLIREVLEKYDNLKIDRINFRSYGLSAMEFEVVYIFQSPNFNDYADTHEKLLWEIGDVFDQHKLEFALQTQAIVVENKN